MARPGAPLQIVTHAQRVCRLYKKAYRTKSDMFFERYEIRIFREIVTSFSQETNAIVLTYNTIESVLMMARQLCRWQLLKDCLTTT